MTVYQVNRAGSISTDGQFTTEVATRRGILAVNTIDGLIERWIADGRVFQTGSTLGTTRTASAAGTAVTATAPSWRATIPAGTVMVPIYIGIATIQVAAKRANFAISVNDTDTYTSGGTAGTAVKNMLVESASAYRASVLTNVFNSNSAITEAAATNPRILKIMKRTGIASELNVTWNPEYNIRRGDPLVFLAGPASINMFDVQETTADAMEYTCIWAELDKAEYVNT